MEDFSPKSDDIDAEIDSILGTKSKKPAKIASPKTVSNDIDTEIDDILSGFSGADPVGKTVGKSAIKTARKRSSSPYDHLIEDSARRHGVDPDLIRRQMGTESSFNPNAKSHKNAMGLMQLIPGTARRMGVTNIYDPKQNIEGGVKYMRQLLDMFGGDVNLALAGYNAGEGAVKKYGNKVPPYAETRKYVKQIGSGYTGNGYLRTKTPKGGYQSTPPSSLAIGDSIAAGLIWHGGLGGNANKGVQRDFSKGATASVGSTPKEILANIQAMPDKAVRGQSVVLSTGASNDPKSLDVIQSQIDALRKKGATNITLLGVGSHKNLVGVNDYLAKIAQDNGVTFTGALKTGKDQIHPTHWGKLAKSLPINAPAQAPQDVDPITSIDDEIDSLLSGLPSAPAPPEVPDGSVYNKPADTPTGLPDNSGSATGTPNEIFQSRTSNLENPIDMDFLEKTVDELSTIGKRVKNVPAMDEIALVPNKTATQPQGKRAQSPIDMPDAPVTQATDADFEEANKYLASVGQPQITREQFDVAQKTVGKNAQATGYETQAEVPQQGQPAQQSQQRPQEIRGPVAEREPTKWKGASTVLDDDQLLKTDLSYVIDLSQVKGDKKAYVARAGQNALMKQWGLTAEQAAKFISANAAPYTDADKATRILVNRGELADLIGADRVRQDYDEERAGVTQDWYQANDGDVRAQKANKPTFDDVSRADFYRPSGDELLDEARYNVIQSPPTMGSEDDAIRQEYERLKKYSLTEDEKAEMTRAGENTANWFSPKASAALSGAMGGGGRVLNWLAGALRLDQSNPLSPLQLLPESWTIALAKTGNKMTGASAIEAKKNPGFANAAIRIVSGLPYDLPRYALLSRLPGGAVAMFAADSGLQSAGRGERADTVIAETTKGAAMGAIFKGSGKLYNKVEDFALKAFKNPVFDRASKGTIPDEKLKNLTDALKFDAKTEMRMASDPAFKAQVMADVRAAANEEWQKQILLNPQVIANTPKERLAAKLFGEGAKVGAIGTGTAYLTRVTSKASTPEEANEEAWNEGVTMALTSLALDHGKGVGKGIKDLAGRIYRATVGTKTADVTVMPNGDIKLLKGAVPDDVVDASVRVDNGEASFNEQAKSREDISKSQKEGEAKLNNEIFKRQQAEKVTKERGLPEAPPKRVESPTTEAVTKATNHPVAQRVSTILADGKPRTLDDIARESRLKSADKISEAIDTLYAAGQIQINPDGTVQINGGERPDTSLYDQFDASGRIKPTTVPTTPVAPVVNTQDDDEDLPFTPASTPKVDTKEYPVSDLPTLVQAEIRRERFEHPQRHLTQLSKDLGVDIDQAREIAPTLPFYTDEQLAKKFNIPVEKVSELRPLGSIGYQGYVSHRVRSTILDEAHQNTFNELSDIFTNGEVRFRDADYEGKFRMSNAVLDKIAESVGKSRSSQMTKQDWSKVLIKHAKTLSDEAGMHIVRAMEEGEDWQKEADAFRKSPELRTLIDQILKDHGVSTWEDLNELNRQAYADKHSIPFKDTYGRSGVTGHGPAKAIKKAIKDIGRKYAKTLKSDGNALFTDAAITRAYDRAIYERTNPSPQGRSTARQAETVSASVGKKPATRGTASASSTQKVAPIKVVKKSEPKPEPKTETKPEPKKAPVVAENVETREEVAPEPKKATEVKEKPKKPTLEGTKEEIKKEKVETLHSVPVTAKGQSTADAQVFIEADIDPTVKLTPNKTSSVWRVKSPDGIEVKGATYKEALDIAQRIADGIESGSFFSRPNVSTTAVLSQIKPYTTTVLTKLKQFQGRDVKIQTVRETLKQGGIKAQDKKMIERVLNRPEFKDANSIPYDELDKAIRLEVMPLQVIETQTYADYGKQNVGVSADSTKTYIFNSPVSHGYKGHFGGDFNDGIDVWDIREVKDRDTGEITYLAVPEGPSFQGTTEAEAMSFVGTASNDRNTVEKWVKERGGIRSTTNEGLYGHSRVWRDQKDSYNAEDQSDTYQKQNLERMLIESYLNDYRNNKLKIGDVSPELYTTLRKLDAVLGKTNKLTSGHSGGLWNAVNSVKSANAIAKNASEYAAFAQAMLDSLTKSTAPKGVLGKWNTFANGTPDYAVPSGLDPDERDEWLAQIKRATKTRLSDQEARDSLERVWWDFRNINGTHGESKREQAQKVTEVAEIDAINRKAEAVTALNNARGDIPSYMTYERLVEDEKDLTKDVTKYFTSTDEQFIAHKKNYIARILRETIRIEALADQERFLIPTALTAARIEGFVAAKRARGGAVGTANGVYEVEDGADEGTLSVGDTIRMDGYLYHVAEATDDTIEVVPDDEVYSYTYGDFAEGEYENEYSNLQYEARRKEGTWMSPKQLTDFIKDELYLYDIDSDDYAEMFGVMAPNPDYDPDADDGHEDSFQSIEFDPGEYDGDPSDIEEVYFSQTRPFISAVENELSQREYDLGEYMTHYRHSWELPSGDGYYYSDAQSETFDQPWVIREREEEAAAAERERAETDRDDGITVPEVKKLGREAIEQPVMKDFSDERQTILKKYIELENLFFDEREDVEVVEDAGGNQWLASPLVEADKGDVIVFNRAKAELEAENAHIDEVLGNNYGSWENIGRAAEIEGNGDMAWMNNAARLIISQVFGHPPPWTGVYNTTAATNRLIKGLATFHTVALANGDIQLAKGIDRVLEGVRAGVDPVVGDLVLFTRLPEAPNAEAYGVQEEKLHRAELRLQTVADWKLVPRYEVNPAYRQAARRLGEGNYAGMGSGTIHHEIVAKMFRDDAEIELGLTYNQLQSIRLLHYDQLIANGVTDAEIEKAYNNISKNASQWIAAQRSQDAQPNTRGVNATRGSPNAPQFSRLQGSGDGRGEGVDKALKPYPFARDVAQNVDEKGQRIPQALFSRPTNVAGDAFPDIEGIPEEELTMEAHRTRIEKVIGQWMSNHYLGWVYDGRREVTPAEAIGNTMRAGYLLGASVGMTNLQGNPINQVAEQIVKIFSGPLDWANSKVNPKSGYERHNPGLSGLDILTGLFGERGMIRTGLGVKKGTGKLPIAPKEGSIWDVIVHGVRDEEREKFDLSPQDMRSQDAKEGRWDKSVVRNSGIPAWDLAIEASVRMSSALDRPFKAFKNASEMRGLARLTAKAVATKHRKVDPDAAVIRKLAQRVSATLFKERVMTRKQQRAFMKELHKDPNAWMQAAARRSAENDTFQNPNAVSDQINKLKKQFLTGRFLSDNTDTPSESATSRTLGQLAYLMMVSAAPFLNTPVNIGVRAVEWSPLGLGLGAVRAWQMGRSHHRVEWAKKLAERWKKEDAAIAKERLQENRDIKSVLKKYTAQKKAKRAELDQAIADINASTVMTEEFKNARIKKAKANYKSWKAGWDAARSKAADAMDKKLADAGVKRAEIDEGIAADRAREEAEGNRLHTTLEQNAFTSGLARTGMGSTVGTAFLLGVFFGILKAVGYVDYDDDPKEWEKRRDAGIPDASIEAFGYRFPYDNSPPGKYLAMAVTAMEQAQRPGTDMQKADAVFWRTVWGYKNLFPYTDDRFDSDDKKLSAGKWIKSITPFVNMKILEEIADVVDDKPRTTYKQGITAPFKMTFYREGLPEPKHPMGKRQPDWKWRAAQKVNPLKSNKQVKEKNWAPSPHKK